MRGGVIFRPLQGNALDSTDPSGEAPPQQELTIQTCLLILMIHAVGNGLHPLLRKTMHPRVTSWATLRSLLPVVADGDAGAALLSAPPRGNGAPAVGGMEGVDGAIATGGMGGNAGIGGNA